MRNILLLSYLLLCSSCCSGQKQQQEVLHGTLTAYALPWRLTTPVAVSTDGIKKVSKTKRFDSISIEIIVPFQKKAITDNLDTKKTCPKDFRLVFFSDKGYPILGIEKTRTCYYYDKRFYPMNDTLLNVLPVEIRNYLEGKY